MCQGENIYIESGTSLFSVPTKAVDDWDSEKKFYDFDSNTCADNEQCGHYTQNVWAGTTSVGCGVRAPELIHTVTHTHILFQSKEHPRIRACILTRSRISDS